ncbi:ATP-sensitive inward rectifier potassium channel 8-like [Phlebotomus argentipes]|uniref:ATP-sensitive inward rectifier potassium channel 8-like n=1 Tax=Phlebotomus argentipes TaxID=94469 RepID=UPI002892ADBB|nr:ATP-sensitive inward rectifier potassium channel 8-like [Phlebotomus argentipes]
MFELVTRVSVSIGKQGKCVAKCDSGRSCGDWESASRVQRATNVRHNQSVIHTRGSASEMLRGKNTRIYEKNGGKNIRHRNVSRRSVKFAKDFATTLIEGRWRYTLVIFAVSFVGSWAFFALLWQLIAQAHGDLDFDETGRRLNEGTPTCLRGASDYAGFFLLSLETQVTTGYGEKYPNEECPEAIFLLMLQMFIGVVIEGAMVGVVYAKLTRPPRHAGDLVFTRNCVICLRDGVFCLLFRISNAAQHQEINSRVEAILCEKNVDGETLSHKLELENDGNITLFLPYVVSHAITEGSPLYGYSAADLLQANIEILVTLTGSSKATGMTTQARTSYVPSEILWGYRFTNIIHYDHQLQSYVIDGEEFNVVKRVNTPFCSAKRLSKANEMQQKDLRARRRAQDTGKSCCSKYSLQMDMQVAEIAVDDFKKSYGAAGQFETQSWAGVIDGDLKDL